MIFQEKYELNHRTSEFFGQSFELLILGGEKLTSDIRTCNVKNKLPLFNGRVLYLRTDEKAEMLQYDLTDAQGEDISSGIDLHLIPDLRKLLRTLEVNQLTICIDITCLQQALIFLLTRILVNELKPKNFYAAYTEPEDYINRQHSGTSQEEEGEEYELYDRIIGLNYTVPGFAKISRTERSLLVASVGFEKQRLLSIVENIEPSDGVIPVVGFPSFAPGMNLTSLFMNYKVLEDTSTEGMIETCEASSPFAFYNILESLYRKKEANQEILVAPLGTRPHCLGAALFVTRHSGFHLIYDFPVEKTYRSSGVLKSNIYFLFNYLV
jgi:hypothetical protein